MTRKDECQRKEYIIHAVTTLWPQVSQLYQILLTRIIPRSFAKSHRRKPFFQMLVKFFKEDRILFFYD